MKKIIVISGPTASGKTNLSIKLANFFKGEIINADSVQFYQKFNIGSDKISLGEQKKIRHHLLDIIHPEKNYNISDFQKQARILINRIPIPFIVGGSGLYIKAALFDYELENNQKKTNIELINLQEMLKQIKIKDPNLTLDEKNPHRIISAFKHLQTNKLRSQKKGKNNPLFDICFIYLNIEKNILKTRIITRLEKIFQKGFIQEVQELIQKYPKANFNIIGYREVKNFLEKKINLLETKNLIIQKTIKYAKRQKTWFQNQIKNLTLVDALCPQIEKKTINIIQNFLKKE